MEIETRNLTDVQKASLSSEYDKILAFCADESADYSLSHYKKMCRIVGERLTPNVRIRKKKTRLAAVLIAAVMLLALVGCTAVVYSEQIGNFFTEIYEDHIKGSFAEKEEHTNQFIQEYYTLNDIPDGYELTEESISKSLVRYIWQSQNGNRIVLIQAPLNAGHYFMDNNSNSYTKIETEKYTVYSRIINGTYAHFWSNTQYEFALYFDTELSKEEIINIISQISPIEK